MIPMASHVVMCVKASIVFKHLGLKKKKKDEFNNFFMDNKFATQLAAYMHEYDGLLEFSLNFYILVNSSFESWTNFLTLSTRKILRRIQNQSR